MLFSSQLKQKARAHIKSDNASPKPRLFQRGGKRTRHKDYSSTLTAGEVSKLCRAIIAASDSKMPFNRFITIHWERAGIAEKYAAHATSRFLKLARDILRSKKLSFAYVWVRENDEGNGSKGDHVHILAHIPKGQSLGRYQRRWIRTITGKPYQARVIQTRSIAGRIDAPDTMPDLYKSNLDIVQDYILKGSGHDAAKANGLSLWQDGGRVYGQRMGMSKNLSRTISDRSIA